MPAIEQIFPEDFESAREFDARVREAMLKKGDEILTAAGRLSHGAPPIARHACSRCRAPLALDECACGACMSCHDVVVGDVGLEARCPAVAR